MGEGSNSEPLEQHGDLCENMTGRRADARQLEETVDHPELSLTGSRNTGLQQFALQGLSLV